MKNKNTTIARAVARQNFARSLVVESFMKCSASIFAGHNGDPIRIAVIGGSEYEPEVLALQQLGFKTEVTVLGLEEFDTYLDLNSNPSGSLSPPLVDLVLCSQVIEHIWHHQHFFEWMKILSKNHAYLWLAAPAANRPHGLPDFYAAGFTQEFLEYNLGHQGFSILGGGTLGSKRLYVSALTSEVWLSVFGHRVPPLTSFGTRSWAKTQILRLKFLPTGCSLWMRSGKVRSDLRYATEVWVWACGPS
jgi:hypothetical protein